MNDFIQLEISAKVHKQMVAHFNFYIKVKIVYIENGGKKHTISFLNLKKEVDR